MKIFYFTSTGNCLSIAKYLGGELCSIPQMVKAGSYDCSDDVIGLVSPIYGFGLPKIVVDFLKKAKWQADYTFAVLTYGNLSGAALVDLKKTGLKLGIRFDYLEKVIMVDNYLPGFSVESQLEKLPDRKVPEALARIRSDIQNRATNAPSATVFEKLSTGVIQKLTAGFSNGKGAKNYNVNEACTQCGICVKVCPTGNIELAPTIQFNEKCIACLGCVHNCPQNAIHLSNERSAARFRNADVTLSEILTANDQT